jgi:mono/diheme cytochrome c family protein
MTGLPSSGPALNLARFWVTVVLEKFVAVIHSISPASQPGAGSEARNRDGRRGGVVDIRGSEDRRLMHRSRLWRFLVCASLALGTIGCSDAWPLQYVEDDALVKTVEGKTNLADKPILKSKIRAALTRLFGESPQQIRIPEGAPLREGGLYLATYMQEGSGDQVKYYRLYQDPTITAPVKVSASESADFEPQKGGYALYRHNCLHCHGVSGAGDGPTAPFLYPTPRDYRKGIFKFTSTPSGARPHRDDLRRTITHGLHGTSMPAFHSLMTPSEIEQVIDYVVFLSIRGETELALIEAAAVADEKDPDALSEETVNEEASNVFNKWKVAQTQVFNPPSPRTASSHDSIVRGRDLFLGRTAEKLECSGCHGALAEGNGPSFVSQDVFNEVVFGGNPSERLDRLRAILKAMPKEQAEKLEDLWKKKADDWGNPLRPANLNRAVYKGGRRPIDIYWRIFKGINGAQMPGHGSLNDKQVWDLVNFVLALPYEPRLLKDAPTAPAPGQLALSGQPEL